jgi:oligoendopeptidase F
MRVRTIVPGALVALGLLLPSLVAAQAARERSEIEERYQWNLADLYPGDEAWEADFAKAGEVAKRLEGLRAELGPLDSARKLLSLEHAKEDAERLGEKLYVYAALKGDQDTRVSKYQGYRQQMEALGTRIAASLAWVEPAILEIPRKKVEQWMAKDEDLATYRHAYEDLWRQQSHVLSEKEERILSLAGDLAGAPGNAYDQMMNADLTFGTFKDSQGQDVEMTQARYMTYMRSPDRRVRKDAWSVYYDGYERYLHAAAQTYAGAVQRDIFYTRARGYSSCAERALDADNVPVSVLDNLIATIGANVAPMRRYNEIKAKVMDVDTLEHWDQYVSLVPSLDIAVPYEQAVDTIVAGLAPLGPKYVEDMKKGFASRWIDVYENAGKQDGAYSFGTFAAPHPYMLLNYESRLDDMFTLAHEMGHSMHTFYTVATQPQVYADYSLFVAEVASTTNEALLMDYLLRQPMDRERKIFLLNQYIQQIQGTVYTQVMFSEFERRSHEMAEAGEPLTVDALNALYLGLLDKYSGGAVHYRDRSGGGWCRIGHFYRNFYVYKYATSYAAATALSRKILDGEPGAVDRYLEFLKSGSSDYPIELLMKAGVDLSKPEPVQATCDLLAKLVNELDALLAEGSRS